MKKLVLFISAVFITFSISSQDISGKWSGEIKVQNMTLGFVFDISKNEIGYQALMDIPKQGLNNAKAETTTFIDSVLTITFPEYNIKYTGSYSNKQINGSLNQSGREISLNLSPGASKFNRPQTPKAPFPYSSEEVSFKNLNDGTLLSGTLTIPDSAENFPMVVIVSGSGPQDRDGTLFGHKLYYVLADYLTRNGIAVLRYDERGVGKSGGRFSEAEISDFEADVNAALNYLLSRKDIGFKNIGLIGHSIGGIIAPKLASEHKKVDFLVLLAAPGVNGDSLMLAQKAAIERQMGLNDMQINQGQNLMSGIYKIIIDSKETGSKLGETLTEYLKTTYGAMIPENQRQLVISQVANNEVAALIRSKPDSYLSKISQPVLALNGSNDLQILPEENLKAIENGLIKGGNDSFQTKELQGLNHLFQESKTGAPSEYGEIEQTFSPTALSLISDWINGLN